MSIKGTCPICRKEVPVKGDGTLRQHRKVTVYPGKRVIDRCQGSGVPPLGPWPSHKPHTQVSR